MNSRVLRHYANARSVAKSERSKTTLLQKKAAAMDSEIAKFNQLTDKIVESERRSLRAARRQSRRASESRRSSERRAARSDLKKAIARAERVQSMTSSRRLASDLARF